MKGLLFAKHCKSYISTTFLHDTRTKLMRIISGPDKNWVGVLCQTCPAGELLMIIGIDLLRHCFLITLSCLFKF